MHVPFETILICTASFADSLVVKASLPTAQDLSVELILTQTTGSPWEGRNMPRVRQTLPTVARTKHL
jgi:hypothetical protein